MDFFGIDGQPTDYATALQQLVVNQDQRIVDRTVVTDAAGDAAVVLTVFNPVRLDDGDNPPSLWETLIHRGAHDGKTWWYTSRAGAKQGHADAVAYVHGDV